MQVEQAVEIMGSPCYYAAMKLFISLIGMVLIFESLPYIAFPDSMRQWLRQLSEMESPVLRIFGFFALGAGLLLCYLAQRTSWFS
ncbi:MAG: DUF2065 domain-containing protein [Thermodesulfobacteriota bacterium]